MNWKQATVCSSTAGKRTAIAPDTVVMATPLWIITLLLWKIKTSTSGRFNGVTSMHHPFRLYMKSIKSEAADLCFIQMI